MIDCQLVEWICLGRVGWVDVSEWLKWDNCEQMSLGTDDFEVGGNTR